MNRGHGYTLVCRFCDRIMMLTRNMKVPRPVRYSVCTWCIDARIGRFPIITRGGNLVHTDKQGNPLPKLNERGQ